MSIMKMSALALAVAGVLGLATTASAATLDGPGNQGAPAKVAYFTVNASGDVNAGVSSYQLSIQSADNLAGRTTGMGVRITFPAGVKLASNPTVSAGPGMGTGAQNPTVQAGAGGNELILNVVPGSGGLNADGPLLTIQGLQLTGATDLARVDGEVAVDVVLYDPNTARELTTIKNDVLLQSVNPLQISIQPSNTQARIDVGSNNPAGLPKVMFSESGLINLNDDDYFDAGSINFDIVSGSLDASNGQFWSPSQSDNLTTTVTGQFGAFRDYSGQVRLQQDNCSYHHGPGFDGVVSASGDKVSFDQYVPAGNPSLHLCFVSSGQHTIDATAVHTSTVFNHGAISTAPVIGDLTPMVYNGASVQVTTFNPGGNTTQQSFLRVLNAGNMSGMVTIYGYDQNGVKHGPITFDLASHHSLQINSDDLENGNAGKFSGMLGDGYGKWYLDMTAEFNHLKVQSLMRNNATGTVTNLTGDVEYNPTLLDLLQRVQP